MCIENARDEVASLYRFRDEYFTNHETIDAYKKDDDVQEKLKAVLLKLDSIKNDISPENKGELHYLKGRALNIGAEYCEESEQELGKATKFNLPESWNELGECLYKKGDLNGAKSCFERAISLENKNVYKRNMSMLMRTLPWKDTKERAENIAKGLEYAREALKEDVSDGHSWMVLGNAYLSSFFTIDASLEVLKNCKAAYAKAESDKLTVLLPELHFNKFQAQWYEEFYSDALASLWRAYELEPSWKECKSKYDESWNFLSKLTRLSKNKGQLNQRRLNNLVSDIKPNQLGPYEKGGSSVTDNKQPTLITINQLTEGSNKDKIIQGKVVCTVVPETGIPFSFCFIDKEHNCIAVNVYNWANECGVKIGDSIAIVAPVLKHHVVQPKHINDILEFKSIRVAVPVMLVVNKRRITAGQVAASRIVFQRKSE